MRVGGGVCGPRWGACAGVGGAHLQVPVYNVFLVTVVHSRHDLEGRAGRVSPSRPRTPRPLSDPYSQPRPRTPGLPEAQAEMLGPHAPIRTQQRTPLGPAAAGLHSDPPDGLRHPDTLPAGASEPGHHGQSPPGFPETHVKNAAYLQRNTRPRHTQHSPGPTPPALPPSPLLARHRLSVSFYPHTRTPIYLGAHRPAPRTPHAASGPRHPRALLAAPLHTGPTLTPTCPTPARLPSGYPHTWAFAHS